jgi:hypothetical protein
MAMQIHPIKQKYVPLSLNQVYLTHKIEILSLQLVSSVEFLLDLGYIFGFQEKSMDELKIEFEENYFIDTLRGKYGIFEQSEFKKVIQEKLAENKIIKMVDPKGRCYCTIIKNLESKDGFIINEQ